MLSFSELGNIKDRRLVNKLEIRSACLPADRITGIFFVSQLLFSVRMPGQR